MTTTTKIDIEKIDISLLQDKVFRKDLKKQIQLQLATDSFHHFVKQAWSQVVPGTFVDNWHVRIICDLLERVSRGQIKKLIINIPPGHGKSALVAILWPVWDWIQKPSRSFIYATYAQNLSNKMAKEHRNLVKTNWFQERWGKGTPHDIYLDRSNTQKKQEFENNHKGVRFSTGKTGEVTGRRSNIIIFDDLNKAQDASGRTGIIGAEIRKGVEFLTETLWSRRTNTDIPEEKTAFVGISQRLHWEDVAGWAVQQGDWVHLNLPMEAEYAERCFIIETADKQIRSALGPHDANTILQNEGGKIIFEDTRQDREILFPALITRAELEDLKKALGPVNASAQLQQKPTPATGTKINPDHFKLYDYNIHKSLFEQRGKTIISVDPASTANINADYSVIQVWRMIYSKDGDKNSFYLIDQIRQKEGIKATLQYIVRMLQRYPGIKDVVVEKASGGFAILEFLREGLSKEALATIHDFSPATDKISRVEAISAWIEEGYVYIPDPKGAPFNVFDFVDEVRTFPLGKHDDQVDSLSQAILFVNLNNADKPIAHIQMLSKAWKFY